MQHRTWLELCAAHASARFGVGTSRLLHFQPERGRVLAIAGLGIRDIMGYCVMALILGLVIYGGALLVFA